MLMLSLNSYGISLEIILTHCIVLTFDILLSLASVLIVVQM
jgi:hypothetical protein